MAIMSDGIISVSTRRFVKFLVTGALNTGINYITFVLLVYVDVNYLVAAISGYVLALLNSYILNKKWTFMSRRSTSVTLVLQFVVVNLLALGVNLLLLYIFYEQFGLDLYVAQAISIAIGIMINYSGYKIVFDK